MNPVVNPMATIITNVGLIVTAAVQHQCKWWY